jgi:O-acetyl-ADP-ribose deacetylase (regulator of RNase III)
MKVIQSFGPSAPGSALRLVLCDINADMTSAWLDRFFGVDAVEIRQGDLLETGADAVVSPANSFGDMSGGVDKRIDDHFEGAAQNAIMKRIADQFLGELPVGMAIVVPTEDTRTRYVIAAPTMRVPGHVANTLNAYLAMRSALVAVYKHNLDNRTPIKRIAVPGLCTGVGRMSCTVSANQMRAAYDNVLGGGWKEVLHPVMAPFALGNTSIRWRDPA